ncbi:MAG: Transcription elongation factor GreA [Chloroflexi bacterium]|nr:Transcription elongation factor GreA [Chloroflexota bacterium]
MADGPTTSAAALLREVGLLPDGPTIWGRPLTTRAPGVYLVELPAPLPAPRFELAVVGHWIERVPDLRMDGVRPTSKAVAARLASLWHPSAVVVYAGSTAGSLGGRALALAHHVIGDRRPHADGHWLHLLVGIERARLWYAETDAPEEYLDAVLDAFAAALPSPSSEGRPSGALPLPWANLRRPTGERQAHGLTASILPDETVAVPPGRVVEIAPGDADGARAGVRGGSTVPRAPRATTRPAAPRGPRAPRPAALPLVPPSARVAPVQLSPGALTRLEAELDELTRLQRPGVVARIKAARELGDLRENAEYQAAREEQSFMEGRIRLLEERRRAASIVEETGGERAAIGSVVVVRQGEELTTFTLVGSTESDPASGRLSVASPVGAALLGSVAGNDVTVRTPRGPVQYRVEAVH